MASPHLRLVRPVPDAKGGGASERGAGNVASAAERGDVERARGAERDRAQPGVALTSTSAGAAEQPLGPGDVLDRYRIVRMIGMGGMSRVYEAEQVFTGRRVALKVMLMRFSSRPDVIARFQKEAIALCRIQHPNVVAVEYGGLTETGQVFIAMEFLEGKTLREVLIDRRRLGRREAIDLVAEIASGVAAAHDLSVIHRDLKPENIFCTTSGRVKVLDLGLAKLVGFGFKETEPEPGARFGTAAYISPERLTTDTVDARSDVYSLGLVLYECVEGRHPLCPEGAWPAAQEIALRQITYVPSRASHADDALWAVMRRAMAKHPERRLASMHEFGAALRALGDPQMRAPSIRSDEGHRATRSFENAPPAEARADPVAPMRHRASRIDPDRIEAELTRAAHYDARAVRSRSSTRRRRPSALPTRWLLAGALGGLVGLIGAVSAFVWTHRKLVSTESEAGAPTAVAHKTEAPSRPTVTAATTVPAPSPTAGGPRPQAASAWQSTSQPSAAAQLGAPPKATALAPRHDTSPDSTATSSATARPQRSSPPKKRATTTVKMGPDGLPLGPIF